MSPDYGGIVHGEPVPKFRMREEHSHGSSIFWEFDSNGSEEFENPFFIFTPLLRDEIPIFRHFAFKPFEMRVRFDLFEFFGSYRGGRGDACP